MNVATKQFGIVPGPQVLVAAADPSKPLKALILRDACKQAAFAVAALTARIKGEAGFPEAREDSAPLRPRRVRYVDQAGHVSGGPDRITRTDGVSEFTLRLAPLPVVESLVHRPSGWQLLSQPSPLVELVVDGRKIGPEDLVLARKVSSSSSWVEAYEHTVKGFDGLVLGFCLTGHRGKGLILSASVRNDGQRERRVALKAPVFGPYRLSSEPRDAYYLLPRRGAAFDNRPCSFRERYCGPFPMQFVDTFNPGAGRGLALFTLFEGGWAEPRVSHRSFALQKSAAGAYTVAIDYPERALRPGGELATPPTHLCVTNGDWHHGLDTYLKAAAAWRRPTSRDKPWFREIFNFRQRFLWAHDPLYDATTGELHLERAVEEARREFGGIDYLHLFDWGNCGPHGRIYGRTGDYSPYDYIQGGREALRKAIEGVQKQGVPVGLYIEGYLLTARGKLGQAHGKDWQIIGPDGKGKWWPGNQEMMICPGVKDWQEVQASTYETKVKELGVDGMYIDQFGFANSWKDCYSKDHGHPVPSYPVTTEREMTKLVRERVEKAKPGVAIYTEETPVDVTTPFQDGSFTYAMAEARRTQTLVPINIARFAFPDFKTIEILVCDHPTGSWATGVKWVFFNGEAIWLEGPPEWFEPETREAIRRFYRILRKHKDAFAGLWPVPLVPTEMGGVWANKFHVWYPTVGKEKTVYTLYNARHRTVRGEVLRVPHAEGTTWFDEWHEQPAAVRVEGKEAVISLEIGPMDVGCVVGKR